MPPLTLVKDVYIYLSSVFMSADRELCTCVDRALEKLRSFWNGSNAVTASYVSMLMLMLRHVELLHCTASCVFFGSC